MKKELPKIYAKRVDKDTNDTVSYTKHEEEIELVKKSERTVEKSVDDKIREILSSIHYVYKMEVVIQTEDGEMVKQLVGKNKDAIITMDNEQIPIRKIKDIYIKEKK